MYCNNNEKGQDFLFFEILRERVLEKSFFVSLRIGEDKE